MPMRPAIEGLAIEKKIPGGSGFYQQNRGDLMDKYPMLRVYYFELD